jgi:hypothetical protein
MRKISLLAMVTLFLVMMVVLAGTTVAQGDDEYIRSLLQRAVDEEWTILLLEDGAWIVSDETGSVEIVINIDQELSEEPSDSTGEVGATTLFEGLWTEELESETLYCSDGYPIELGTGYPLIVRFAEDENVILYENPGFSTEFRLDREGTYVARSTQSSDGISWTWQYTVTDMSPTRISGELLLYSPQDGCNVATQFHTSLENRDVICIVASRRGGNLRTGPGTEYPTQGVIQANKSEVVVGQAMDNAGFTWFKLEDGLWARTDIVQDKAGDCENVPILEPES